MRLRHLAVFGLFAIFAVDAAASEPQAPLAFTVLRDGDKVGSNIIRFQPQPGGVNVTIDTQILVKIAMIPVYRFEHHGEETWRDGRLQSLTSNTNDDGKRHALQVAAGQDQLQIDGDGQHKLMPNDAVPASLWNSTLVTQSSLLNTLDGSAMAVKIADLDQDKVSVHGQEQLAHHYAVTGDLKREVWYDASGSLVQVRFKAEDDSKIEYVLK